MMLGVVAQRTDPGEAGVGPGADDYRADFVHGTYSALGLSVSANQVIANPEFITANGLDLGDNSAWAVVPLVGDFLSAALMAHWTIIIEFEAMVTSSCAPFIMQDDTGGNQFVFVASFNDSFASYMYDSVKFSSRREVSDNAAIGLGIHKFAVSRSDSRIAMSVDGGTVRTNENDLPSGGSGEQPLFATFGGFADLSVWDNIRIRTFRLEPTIVEDAQLPTLSTP